MNTSRGEDRHPDSERPLDESKFIRRRMFSDGSAVSRYLDIVAGPEIGIWSFLRLELTQLLFGGLPGALGLALRRFFYPDLFGSAGRGCVFGRDLTLRHPRKIHLGDGVVIDERCVLDGHGAGQDGVRIGDRVILNRGSVVQAKIGSIQIGPESDIGADTLVISQGGTSIGRGVSIGGGSMIGGGSIALGRTPTAESKNDGSFESRGQLRFTRGRVEIGDFVAMGRGAMVMDGASIGAGSIIAAGAIVRGDIPDESVVTLTQRLSIVPRKTFDLGLAEGLAESMAAAPSQRTPPSHDLDALLGSAIAEVNAQNPADRQLPMTGDAALLEPDGPLDSMGLINLIVAIEEQIEARYGVALQLAERWGEQGAPRTVEELRSRLADGLRERN